jgi:hypothetical protein
MARPKAPARPSSGLAPTPGTRSARTGPSCPDGIRAAGLPHPSHAKSAVPSEGPDEEMANRHRMARVARLAPAGYERQAHNMRAPTHRPPRYGRVKEVRTGVDQTPFVLIGSIPPGPANFDELGPVVSFSERAAATSANTVPCIRPGVTPCVTPHVARV